MFLSNLEELKNLGLTGATEVKFENSISRTTAVAKPRQIERVVRGAQFPRADCAAAKCGKLFEHGGGVLTQLL